MLLTVYLITLSLVALFCLWLHWQKTPPVTLYLAATALLFVAAAVVLTVAWVNPAYFDAVTVSTPTPDGAYQDTYYVVVRPLSQMLWITLALGPVGLVWLQGRTRTQYHPQGIRWLFWPLFLGLMLAPVLAATWMVWGMPQRYTDYTAHVSRVSWLYSAGVGAGLLSLAGLVMLTAAGLVRRYALGHPPSD